MAIKLYYLDEEALEFRELSSGTMIDPLRLSAKPGGSKVMRKVFVRNDDNTKFYTDITIKPVQYPSYADIVGTHIVVKLLSGNTKPTETEWNAANANSSSTLTSPIGGTYARTQIPELGGVGSPDTNYYPIWVMLEAAKSSPLSEVSLALSCDYTEGVV